MMRYSTTFTARFVVLGSWLLFLVASVVLADTASSTSFIIETGVLGAGGGYATSTNFSLPGTFGQPAPGVSSSTSFILLGGFLNFPLVTTGASAVATSAAPTPTVIVSVPGGGVYLTTMPAPPLKPRGCGSPDLNSDGRVDMVDLSILLYYYGKQGPIYGCYDFDRNRAVDFTDVSILMYYWTG